MVHESREPIPAALARDATYVRASTDGVSDLPADPDIVRAWLAAIVDSSDDAIVSKTLEGIITSWNKGAQHLFGYSAAEAIGQSILLIVPADRRDEEAEIIRRLRNGEKIDHFETRRRRSDGQLVDISLTVSPIRDASGTIVGASKIARNISERKQFQQEQERILDAERHAREEAQRLNRVKDEFLATLSHELRTPLNAVMGWAQLIAAGHMNNDDMVEASRVIERNARTQKQLIDDLLDMSRIISGKLRVELQRTEPVAIIEAAIETVQPTADAKDIHIEKTLDWYTGSILADPARMQQVVWNLLTNAIKFTPKGGRVKVKLERVNSHIELTVSDTGQGIKPEFLPHLFARFSQADSSTTRRRRGGLGLGLAIAKQLVELHGGSIQADSAGEGLGSAFVIQLPIPILRHEDMPRHLASSKSDPASELYGLKVLLVDDEPDARELVKRLLSESGVQVRTAESAATAIPLLEDEHYSPDVLVSDIGMPDVDGYEFLRRVRKINGGLRIPAVALTAFARSEDRTRALCAGYIAHVAKPIEPSELLATLSVVAGRFSERG